MKPYTLSNVLILLFFIATSYIYVEARKLTNHNSVFKVDLIHKDSPNSPYYDPSITPQERLKRAPLGSISRGHKIKLSPLYYDTQNNPELSSPLIPNGGSYLIQLALGTPQVQILGSADTGSDLIWTQCAECDDYNCVPQYLPFYDPKNSSTFQPLSCTSKPCSFSGFQKHCAPNNGTNSQICEYEVGYEDGSQSEGVLAIDTITLPSSNGMSESIPSFVFGCGLIQQSNLDEFGIVGLGTGPASLVSQLGPTINYKFSYCLAPLDSEVNSKITFGGDITGPSLVSTPFTTESSTFYYITLDGITVDAKDRPVQVPVGQPVAIDSGTTLTYLPTNVYSGVRAALVKAIGLSPVSSPIPTYDLCYDGGKQLNVPNLVFHFKGADVVLNAVNTFRNIGNGYTCLALVAASDSDFVFGNIAQVNFQVEYDLKAMKVSFAPTDCTTH